MSEPGSLVRSLSGRQTARNYHSYVISEVGLGITSGRLSVGSILPNDAEMMDKYGVSRTVLREALKTLEAKGLVEARAKVGTRVLSKSRWNLFDRQVLTWVQEAGPDRAFLASLVEMREPLELQAAGLAAKRRTADHLRMLLYWAHQRTAMKSMVEDHAMAEFELHRTLFEASQNPFLKAATGLVEFGVVRAIIPRVAAAITDFSTEKAGAYHDLLAGIELGEPELAVAAMAKLLACDRAWILGTD